MSLDRTQDSIKQRFLPENYKYAFLSSSHEEGTEKFSCQLRASIKSEPMANEWLKKFEEKTHTKWIIRDVNNCQSTFAKFEYSKDYVCQLNSKGKTSNSERNHNCHASIKIRIKKDTKWIKSRDIYVKQGLLAIITIFYDHSHRLNNALAWKLLRPTQDTLNEFIQYFRDGLGSVAARRHHAAQLQVDEIEVLADSSVNPPIKWVENQYRKWRNYELAGEATVRILKDVILTRLRAFNAISLLDFIFCELEKYYRMRLTDYAYDRVAKPHLLYQKFVDKGQQLFLSSKEHIIPLNDNTDSYRIKSQVDKSEMYIVETNIGACTCKQGSQGGYCEHQSAVHIKYHLSFPNSPILTVDERKLLFYIANGNSVNMPDEFFKPLAKSPLKGTQPSSTLTREITPAINTSEFYPEQASYMENIELDTETEKSQSVIKDLNNEFIRIKSILESNKSDSFLMKTTKAFTMKCQKVKSPMQLSAFFLSNGHLHLKRQRKIHVQSTTLARRKDRINRGNTVQRSGRPISGIKKVFKRPRNLNLNVKQNRANAKSHGEGH
ncbi:hypothetical protein B566_EDAN013989 [Ephemera danica]|nr:hypothetical protein B566_EDAN013989 [Ephemera danica]